MNFTPPRRFVLVRAADVTGLSGIGVVAYGVEFGDGRAVTRWADTSPIGVAQTTVWDGIADILAVHGHQGATRLEWIDDDGGTSAGVTPPLGLPLQPS